MVEYRAIDKSSLSGKRAIEQMLPELGVAGFKFSFETQNSYVFWREAPVAAKRVTAKRD